MLGLRSSCPPGVGLCLESALPAEHYNPCPGHQNWADVLGLWIPTPPSSGASEASSFLASRRRGPLTTWSVPHTGAVSASALPAQRTPASPDGVFAEAVPVGFVEVNGAGFSHICPLQRPSPAHVSSSSDGSQRRTQVLWREGTKTLQKGKRGQAPRRAAASVRGGVSVGVGVCACVRVCVCVGEHHTQPLPRPLLPAPRGAGIPPPLTRPHPSPRTAQGRACGT